jgi:Telomere resolvase
MSNTSSTPVLTQTKDTIMNAAARKHFPTDSATLQSNLREAAALTEVELSGRTVYQLRDLLRVCGIKQVVRNGVQVPIRQATRVELLKELETATNPYRLLATATIEPELVDEDIRKLDFESVYQLLKLATALPTDPERTEKARATAYEVNEWIAKNYADSPTLARHFARCNHRGQYRARVKELVTKDGDLLLASIFGVFADTLSALGKFDAEAKAKANSERLTTYEDNSRSVSVGKLHEWTLATLANPTESDWKNVVIAIAASTGRRIYSEVLAGSGQYEVASEYEIKFTGVAKGKELNTTAYTLPTIAPAVDVVAAIKHLETGEAPKRVPCVNPCVFESVLECRKKADKRHSKNVGEHWSKRICKELLGFEQTDEQAKADELTKLHGLRKLYVMHFTRGLTDREQRKRASELLCHSGDGSVAADAYTSQFTLAD